MDQTGHNDVARYSLGDTMADTRFFYADAAAQGGVMRWAELKNIESMMGEIDTLTTNVNVALRFLLDGVLIERAPPRKKRNGKR